MALFKRKPKTFNDDLPMPQELQDYYAVENRERSWMAWVLGLATLVLTVVIALGLFYGGRYAYRKVRNNDNKNTATQQAAQKENKQEDTEDDTPEESTTPATESTTPTPQTSSTSTSTPSTATPATTGAQTTAIPNTGPANTLVVVLVVSLLGYMAHRRFATK